MATPQQGAEWPQGTRGAATLPAASTTRRRRAGPRGHGGGGVHHVGPWDILPPPPIGTRGIAVRSTCQPHTGPVGQRAVPAYAGCHVDASPVDCFSPSGITWSSGSNSQTWYPPSSTWPPPTRSRRPGGRGTRRCHCDRSSQSGRRGSLVRELWSPCPSCCAPSRRGRGTRSVQRQRTLVPFSATCRFLLSGCAVPQRVAAHWT